MSQTLGNPAGKPITYRGMELSRMSVAELEMARQELARRRTVRPPIFIGSTMPAPEALTPESGGRLRRGKP